MERPDIWIHDIHAGELINLRDCKGIYIHKDYPKTEDHSAKHSLKFCYSRNDTSYWLHYESSQLLRNALEHYTHLLKCKELDVSQKTITLI